MYIILTVTVDDWVKNKKMKYLGVPKYIAHGTHQRDKENFRFMVMPRFGSDLQKIFEGCGKHFAKETVLALGLRMVYLYLNWLKNHRMFFLCIFLSNSYIALQAFKFWNNFPVFQLHVHALHIICLQSICSSLNMVFVLKIFLKKYFWRLMLWSTFMRMVMSMQISKPLIYF